MNEVAGIMNHDLCAGTSQVYLTVADAFLGELVNHILAVERPHPVRVAIDGIDNAGKTTLADALFDALQCTGRQIIRASLDGFHNPKAVRYGRGPDSPEGYYYDSFDYQAVIKRLLEPLGPVGSRYYRTASFNYLDGQPVSFDERPAADDALLLFDGVFLLRPELQAYWDFRIFVHVSFEVAMARAEARDRDRLGPPGSLRHRYEQRYFPGQKIYLAACKPFERADLVVDNNDPAHPFFLDIEA